MPEKQPIYRSTEDERMYERSYLNPEEAHARAQKKLSEYEIKTDIFTDYDEESLKKDSEEVKRLEGLFELTPAKIYGDILEAVICEYGELSNWFGSQSEVIKTARYDDYKNKIDMVVETKENNGFSHLALGIDVTFGSRDLSEKFARIKEKIDAGTLAELKYFHSDRQHFTGRLRKLSQVVIGVEFDRVKELGLLWMNRRNEEIKVHPAQTTILAEAALQLKTFKTYAENGGKHDLVPIFDRELQKIEGLLAEKRAAGIKGFAHDKVFDEIKRNLALFETGARV